MIVYKLTIADTVEERILQLQDKKRDLANAAIGEGDMAARAKAAKMDMKDIMFLFGHGAERNGQYKEDLALNAKTKILKERRPAPRMEPLPSSDRSRYIDPGIEAAREARRQRERESAYSRR